MKISLALAVAILVIGIVPGLFQHQQLAQLREEHRALVAKAVKLGISVTDADESRQTKKNHRADTTKQAESVAREILAFYAETGGWQVMVAVQDPAAQERGQEMKARLLAMDSSTLRQVIASLAANQEIPEDAKCDLIGSTLLQFTGEHPEKALDLAAQAYDILKGSATGEEVVTSAFQRWAEQSPDAAVSWIMTHAEDCPDMAGDEAKRAVISGTAVNDPARAFRLIGELQPGNQSAAVRAIVGSSYKEPAKRDQLLSTLRDHLGSIKDEQARGQMATDAFESMARHLSKEGFDASAAWVNKARFSPEEKLKFSQGLSYFSTRKDTGRWIDWLSNNLAAESATGPVSTLINEWTQKDHQAAGTWLVAAQDGPVKTSAVQAYASAVAEFEPEVAAQWAMTLPAGPARDSTLRSIHQNWPSSDPDGAAAFARDHGLK